MNIYVLRHGLAAQRTATSPKADRDRPLTAKGEKKLRKIAAAMEAMGIAFDLIVSSPCRRASRTAEIVARERRVRSQIQFMDQLLPEAAPRDLIERLGRMHLPPENLLLVGHEPHLSGVISLLLSGTPHLRIELKKGGLCKLSVTSLKPGRQATLEWLLTPKQMTGMK
jgi:phosphohistidine phosphatase